MMAEINETSYEYDVGTITFTGSRSQGSVTLVNFYDIEYHGEYSVSGLEVSVHMDQVWIGRFFADDRIAGTWMDSNGTTSGQWEAKRE